MKPRKGGSVGKRTQNPSEVSITPRPGEAPAATLARAYLLPTLQAAYTVGTYHGGGTTGGPSISALAKELEQQSALLEKGDLRRAEEMLNSQAHSLDAIFGHLARRAMVQDALPLFEAHLRLALKAQAQCARTLEVLAAIKNPMPLAFVRQANISAGHQQVNNTGPELARVPEIGNSQNKLSEEAIGLHPNFGASQEARSLNSKVDTMDEVHGAKDRRR